MSADYLLSCSFRQGGWTQFFEHKRTSVVKGEEIRFHQTSGDFPCQLLAQDMIIVVKQHETGMFICKRIRVSLMLFFYLVWMITYEMMNTKSGWLGIVSNLMLSLVYHSSVGCAPINLSWPLHLPLNLLHLWPPSLLPPIACLLGVPFWHTTWHHCQSCFCCHSPLPMMEYPLPCCTRSTHCPL